MSTVPDLADPADHGFSADRLARIDHHFARYVDDGRLPGWQVAVARQGQVVHHATYGQRDLAAGDAWTDDTIVRLYSMTKPIVSVAAMMLYEEGAFELKTPVSDFIPEFADTPVLRGGSSEKPVTEPQTEPIRMWHLLTHTAGLTYGFHYSGVSDAIYRANGFDFGTPTGITLEAACRTFASMPLAFQPGSEWLYSVACDVVGRVVEIVSGQSLDEFFRTRIFEPLGMVDTDFHVPPGKQDRFAALCVPHTETGLAHQMRTPRLDRPPSFFGGGGGLCGTLSDYLRFCHMLQNRGELDGVRLLGSRTVDYMTTNHLPGGADLEEFGRPLFAETTYDGVGFGLGFSVVMDPAANKVPSSVGEFAWGGAASTAFWIDPAEELVVVFLTQLLPSDHHPIRNQLKQLVYQALVD